MSPRLYTDVDSYLIYDSSKNITNTLRATEDHGRAPCSGDLPPLVGEHTIPPTHTHTLLWSGAHLSHVNYSMFS